MEPKELYEKLYGAKMYTNSYEQFRKDYSSDEDISELHRKLKQVKAYDGDLASFKSDYFTPVKKKFLGKIPRSIGKLAQWIQANCRLLRHLPSLRQEVARHTN